MIKTAEGDRAKATEAGIQDWLDCGLRPLAGRCPARSSATIRYSAATFKSSVISKRAGREFPTHRSPFSILPVRIAGGTECRSTMDDAQSTPSENRALPLSSSTESLAPRRQVHWRTADRGGIIRKLRRNSSHDQDLGRGSTSRAALHGTGLGLSGMRDAFDWRMERLRLIPNDGRDNNPRECAS